MRRGRSFVGALVALAACGVPGCGGEGGGAGGCDPGPVAVDTADGAGHECDGVSCSGHGSCAVVDGGPACTCDPGFRGEGLACVPEVPEVCMGVECSGLGACVELEGAPVCVCQPGYHAQDLACVPNSAGDPCEGVTCTGHGLCAVAATGPVCACDAGFQAAALSCVLEPTPGDPCKDVGCSGHGRCAVLDGAPVCVCDVGYDRSGLACVPVGEPDDPCKNVGCSGHGACAVLSGSPVCICDDGYAASGLACEPVKPACCNPGPDTRVLLSQGSLTLGQRSSGPIAVGLYREVLVLLDHVASTSTNCTSYCCPTVQAPRFRASAAVPFLPSGQPAGGGRLRVDGSDLELALDSGAFEHCTAVEYHYAVYGIVPGGDCCKPGPDGFEVIGQGMLSLANRSSEPLAVGEYSEVVVSVGVVKRDPGPCIGTGCCPSPGSARFRPAADVSFGATGQDVSSGGRVRVDGESMMLTLGDSTYKYCTAADYQWVVTGVKADTTCLAGCPAAAPTFHVLAQGVLSLGNRTSGPITVAPYREVVVYMTTLVYDSGACMGYCCPWPSTVSFAEDSGFGASGQTFADGGRIRVDGTQMRLDLDEGEFSHCEDVQYQYVVAGVGP